MLRFQKQLLIASGCMFVVLSLLAFGMAQQHALSPRLFGLAILLVMVAGFVAFYSIFKSARIAAIQGLHSGRQSEIPEAATRRVVRRLRVVVVTLPALLVLGLWATRSDPILPRIVGAAINLGLTFWFLSILRRAKKREES